MPKKLLIFVKGIEMAVNNFGNQKQLSVTASLPGNREEFSEKAAEVDAVACRCIGKLGLSGCKGKLEKCRFIPDVLSEEVAEVSHLYKVVTMFPPSSHP